eukprot:m.126115 g.126115  ORF g.126115 m.126115 type:complete len:494 (+) comp29180_c0_seq1:135-1616(+)
MVYGLLEATWLLVLMVIMFGSAPTVSMVTLSTVPVPGVDGKSITVVPASDFEHLFVPQPPWLGADCATSLSLEMETSHSYAYGGEYAAAMTAQSMAPSTNKTSTSNTAEYLWLFADTLVGTLSPTGTRDWKCMPHNSIGIMRKTWTERRGGGGDGAIIDNVQWKFTHYVRGECAHNHSDSANGFFAPQNTSRFYWVENGIIINSRLFLFTPTLSPPCDIGCTQVGIALIEVLNYRTAPPMLWNFTTQDLDEPYLCEGLNWPTAIVRTNTSTSSTHTTGSANGIAIANTDSRGDGHDANNVTTTDYLYLLGRFNNKSTSAAYVGVLARVPALSLLRADDQRWTKIEFYVEGNAWVHVPPTSSGGVGSLHLATLFEDAPPETSLQFISALDRWIILNIPFGSPQLSARVAKELTGPWSKEFCIYNIPKPWVDSDLGIFSYSPKLHSEMITGNTSTELILTFMSNGNITAVNQNTKIYVPQILRASISTTKFMQDT